MTTVFLRRSAICLVLLLQTAAVCFAAEAEPLVLWGTAGTPLTPQSNPEHAGVLWLWKDFQKRQAAESHVLDAERANMPAPVLKQWRTLVGGFPGMAPEEQLRMINGFFNRWSGKEDRVAYGKDEYWASAADFLRTGGGDCEDYALIKYYALRELSAKVDSMWLVLVTDVSREAEHAVLLVKVGKKAFVLDNLSSPVYLIMPVEAYHQIYVPRFALSDQGVFAFVPRVAGATKNANHDTGGNR